MTHHRDLHRFGDYLDTTEDQVDKGGNLFTAHGGGAEVKNNTVNQVTINFNISLNGVDEEQLRKLKMLLDEIKGGVPALGSPDPMQKNKHRWF